MIAYIEVAFAGLYCCLLLIFFDQNKIPGGYKPNLENSFILRIKKSKTMLL